MDHEVPPPPPKNVSWVLYFFVAGIVTRERKNLQRPRYLTRRRRRRRRLTMPPSPSPPLLATPYFPLLVSPLVHPVSPPKRLGSCRLSTDGENGVDVRSAPSLIQFFLSRYSGLSQEKPSAFVSVVVGVGGSEAYPNHGGAGGCNPSSCKFVSACRRGGGTRSECQPWGCNPSSSCKWRISSTTHGEVSPDAAVMCRLCTYLAVTPAFPTANVGWWPSS